MKRIVLARQKVRAALFLVLLLPFASRGLAATPSPLVAQFDRVSASPSHVEAATTEGLGFAGREEGIAAHAVVSLVPL